MNRRYLRPGELRFPDPENALRAGPAKGLVAIGGDLSVERLILAYRSGIFPWSVDPITWWSPEPRAILPLDGLHIPRSLGRTLKKAPFRVTLDAAFEQVIRSCAARAPNRRETWISPEFVKAYVALHRRGLAHSLECWVGGDLVGGIYGVAIGGLFAGESMFHRANDASKVALVQLTRHLEAKGFALFDIQILTPITRQLGGMEIPRKDYLRRLAQAVASDCQF